MGLEVKAGRRQTTGILTWKGFLAPAERGQAGPASGRGICFQCVQDILLSSGQSKCQWDRRAGKCYAMPLLVRQLPHGVNPHLKDWSMLCRAAWKGEALQPVLQRYCIFSLRCWVLNPGLDRAHLKAIVYRTVLTWQILAVADSFTRKGDQFLVQDNPTHSMMLQLGQTCGVCVWRLPSAVLAS